MDGKESVGILIVLGTGVMLLMAFSVIAFIIFYQRRMFKKQNLINQMAFENQMNLIQAEIQGKEREQKRMAQELHDDIGASLNGMRFMIAQLDVSQKLISDLNNTINVISQNVRRISNELLPHVLDELGLSDALMVYIQDLNKKGIPIKFHYKGDDLILSSQDKHVELSLYRIVQELLSNIIKYAEASEVHVVLTKLDELLRIVVIDNGNGIIPEKSSRPKTLGLKNIESRIQYIGGTILKERNNPNGTIVTIEKTMK